jgi:hypothetical protein
MGETLTLQVEMGDLLEQRADLVLLKHARGFFTVDGAVASALEATGVQRSALESQIDEARFFGTRGALAAPEAVFFGTVPLRDIGYHEIRTFMVRALHAIAKDRPLVKHLASTIHGANYGLDEDESVLSLIGGVIEAWTAGEAGALERFTVVELSPRRAQRLRLAVAAGLTGAKGVTKLPDGSGFVVRKQSTPAKATAPLARAGDDSAQKPHAFVAMPFTPEMEDVYHFGIQGPVKAAGLLCERVDQVQFDGLIISRIRERIEGAKVVIADLTGANANVYLEVGYAWGKGRPTLLLVKDVKELKFDVQGHRCIVYRNIRELETLLAAELERLHGHRAKPMAAATPGEGER